MYASRHDHPEVVLLLLKEDDIEINKVDNSGKTALHWASKMANAKVVQLLLDEKGIDINKADSNGNTALIQAANDGNIEIAQLLHEAGQYVTLKKLTIKV